MSWLLVQVTNIARTGEGMSGQSNSKLITIFYLSHSPDSRQSCSLLPPLCPPPCASCLVEAAQMRPVLRLGDTGDQPPWSSLSIDRGDLHLPNTKDPLKGVSCNTPCGLPYGMPSSFVRLPRHSSLNVMGMSNISQSAHFCTLLRDAESYQQKVSPKEPLPTCFPTEDGPIWRATTW